MSDGFGWRAGLGFGYAYSTNFVAFSIREDKVDTYNIPSTQVSFYPFLSFGRAF